MEVDEEKRAMQELQRNKRRKHRSLVLFCILMIFTSPVVFVLWLDIPWPRVIESWGETSDQSDPTFLPEEHRVETIRTVPFDNLVNLKELSLSTGFVVSNTPTLREFDFHISQAYGAPDGFRKLMTLVNGQSPGPLIEANVGDVIRVTVHNEIANMSTSIHWHGIDQKNTTWMDGATGVSQCAIPPGENFTYHFQLIDQRGTFWYHAHTTVQYTDGLFGPIIIHDPDEKIPKVDSDQILFLGDHYHQDAMTLRTSYLLPSSRWSPSIPGVEPLPDNILINGRHTYNCAVTSTTWPDSNSPCSGGSLSLTRAKPNQTLRLRLINHSSFFSLWFSIDDHPLTVIELDGVEVEPIPDQRGVYLNVGQRCSVLVSTRDSGTFTMRATLPQTCCVPYCPYASSGLESIGYEATALLTYDEQPGGVVRGSAGNRSNPFGVENNALRGEVWEGCDDMPFDIPVPARRRRAVEVGAGNMHEVAFRFQQVGDVNRIFINRTSWTPYRNDAQLWQVLNRTFSPGNGGSYNNWDLRLDQQMLLVPDADKGVQIAINSGDIMEHPFHLHGHSFQIVGWGSGEFEGGTSGRTTWNLDNPMRRDTVTIPAQWHVVIRFVADNPGIWALHCHVAWHMEGGMLVSLLERPEDLNKLVEGMDPETRSISQSFCQHTI